MPVNVLLCEGAGGSPDIMLLRAILPRPVVGEVRPSGGKEGLRNLVLNLRRAESPSVCGLADGDFPRKPEDWPSPPPCREWRMTLNGAETMLGWMWRRKEIENYLIDPFIVARAHGWDETRRSEYAAFLESVFDKLSHMTAGRIALTESAPRKTRLETKLRVDAGDDEVREALRRRAAEYNEGARIDEPRLIETYERCLAACLPGGALRARALEVFAGKDVLAMMQQTRGCPSELKNRDALIERLRLALDRGESPHTWLPEWSALHDAVASWAPAS